MEQAGGNKKFEEALQLLNEAAKEKKEELQKLLSEKYSDIREAIEEVAEEKMGDLKRVKKTAEKTLQDQEEKIHDAIVDLENKVKKEPLKYVGGAALGALLIGFVMGSLRRD